VHEWSGLEGRYVVRANDAHAWAMVWVDGAWREVDTTPPDWVAVERAAVASATPLGDLWAWAGYLFSRWRWSEREDRLSGAVGWLLVPLGGLLAWRLYSRRRVAARARSSPARAALPPVGADSAFYEIERALARLAFPRNAAEPLSAWLARVSAARLPDVDTAPLGDLLALHYRYRFDPAGLAAAERAALGAKARAWLAEHATARR
jgi:protein-glutamine gamma-glutamyltransferase